MRGSRTRTRDPRAALIVLLALAGTLVPTASAEASYQLVEEALTTGEVQIGEDEPSGVAVSDATGDIYWSKGADQNVVEFDARGAFLKDWGWGVADHKPEFERCGPDEPTHPTCYHEVSADTGRGIQGTGAGQFDYPRGIAVDQATGHVFVLNSTSDVSPGVDVIQEFTATGEYVGAFGQVATNGLNDHEKDEPITSTPEQLHEDSLQGIAVDASTGDLYVLDTSNTFGNIKTQLEQRVMMFAPTSATRTGYDYAGVTHDIHLAPPETHLTTQLALDDQGDVFTATDLRIFEYPSGDLAAPAREFNAVTAHMQEVSAMTVDPRNGRVYFFSTNGDRKFHELEPEGATFSVVGEMSGGHEQESAFVSAFNPALSWEAGRPEGVLYVGTGEVFDVVPRLLPKLLVYAPPVARLPTVADESAAAGSRQLTMSAEVNPRGSDTSYAFQFGTDGPCSEKPCQEAPAKRGDLGGGQAAVAASVTVTGLTPETTYYYRILATSHCEPTNPSHVCETPGEGREITTFEDAPAGPPDHRVYELVSPPEKHGGEVFALNPAVNTCGCETEYLGGQMPVQAAPDGNSIVYVGFPFSDVGAPNKDEYLSTRTPSGWTTTTLSPSVLEEPEGHGETGFRGFTENLSAGVVGQRAGAPSLTGEAPADSSDLYLWSLSAPLQPLLTAAPPHEAQTQLKFAVGSADFSHIGFEANDALTTETPVAPEAQYGGAESYNLYEQTGGELRLVNVLPGNGTTVTPAAFGSGKLMANGEAPDFNHAMSADGSRIFWTDLATERVFVRVNGDETLEVPDPAPFLTASADGSEVLLDDGRIYNVNDLAEAPVDLSEGAGGFQGMLGQSEDLSVVYFVDTATLPGTGANAFGESPVAGQDNLYVYRNGAIAFITTLIPEDNKSGSISFETRDWAASAAVRNAEASPDGNWLAFETEQTPTDAPLTGYDVRNFVVHKAGVFLYDAASGRLVCASCNPTGERALGRSSLPLIEPSTSYFPQSHDLTDEGRLFFDSKDSLSPNDVNNGFEDVYEYEQNGQGTCARASGCVELISSGHGDTDASFLAADANGTNVFFTTHEPLVPADKDGGLDVYDAREHGGAPVPESQSSCEGEACRGAAPATPSFPELASAAAGMLGGFPAGPSPASVTAAKARCHAGYTLRHGRCTKATPPCKKARKRGRSRCTRPKGRHSSRKASGRAGNRRRHA